MTDPFTLAAVGAVAITQGIKFLYGQAGDVIKCWHQRKAAGKSASAERVDVQLPPDAFAGQLKQPQLHFEAVERLEQDLKDLRAAVADYAQGLDEVNVGDAGLLHTVDALRGAMEAVYGQRITFKGEPGAVSGAPLAVGEAKVDKVLGSVAGLRARRIISGTAIGRVEANYVGPGGEAAGVVVDTVGSEAGHSPDGTGDRKEPGGGGTLIPPNGSQGGAGHGTTRPQQRGT